MKLTFICVIVIVLVFIVALSYTASCDKKELVKNRRRIEQLPPLISTLGVIGTFLGITIALLHFDTTNLNDSIPHLLEGLKTAFFTSLGGMFFSLILSHIVSKKYDELDKGVSNIDFAVAQITQEIKALNQTKQISNDLLQTTNENISVIKTSSQETNLNVSKITNYVKEFALVQNEIFDEVKTFGDKLHNEAVEIGENMDKTNALLEKKFDEFSKLLEKSNTEALVEVMKKVTEEFNRQMSELINKLVQENFEQLNKSVAQLNTWQQENKEMIQSLTIQYKAMEKDFEATSTTLLNVGKDTKNLVSDGSQLHKIVNALNSVMVEDKRFIEIITHLNSAAELNKTSMTEFNNAQSSLNDWVRKQRNFVDAVQALMKQLEDIAKINDYSKEFWKDTRSGMNDSLGIIQQGTKSLMQEIKNLDGHFYTRLNTTLANLDLCIQKMIDKA